MHYPAEFGGGLGDIVHVRSRGVFGYGIRRAIPKTWGCHDCVLVYDADRGWGVAEALYKDGFVVTEWEKYARGAGGVVFLRPAGISTEDRLKVVEMAYALEESHPRYDKTAIIGIAWSILLKRTVQKNREWQWYCTEVVRDFFKAVGWDVWRVRQPTPYTTEKREQAGKLTLLGEMRVDGCPPYRIKGN